MIQSQYKIDIYDINTLNFIKSIKTKLDNMIYKLNEELLISKDGYELIIFKLEDNNLIKHEIIKLNHLLKLLLTIYLFMNQKFILNFYFLLKIIELFILDLMKIIYYK